MSKYKNFKYTEEEIQALKAEYFIQIKSEKIPSIEIEKGDLVMETNGWIAEILDNMKKSSTRFADVYGWEHEMGSIYTHDIQYLYRDGVWNEISLTPSQLKTKAFANSF